MGRLHHLSQTLPSNLDNTASYGNREFILLNYGSKDGLHEWVRDNLRPWVDRGIVKYYRTKEPQFFIATRAKNIAHRQGTGDILCNLDADNFVLEGFAEWLASTMADPKCIVNAPSADIFNVEGSCGKIAVHREHFYSVNGYNEDINMGWGWDDTDFQYRARKHNDLVLVESGKKWSRAIYHGNEDRVRNFRDKDIKRTQQFSIDLLKSTEDAKDYVANKGRNWGVAADLSSDLDI